MYMLVQRDKHICTRVLHVCMWTGVCVCVCTCATCAWTDAQTVPCVCEGEGE